MWMGTYPKLPSYVLSIGETLKDVLNAHKEKLIGKTVLKKFAADLPFLPKVFPTSRPLLDLRLLTAHWPRSSLWPRHFPSESILTRILLPAYTRKTRKNTAMRTTSPRLHLHLHLSSSSSASSPSMRSKPYFSFHPCANAYQVPKHTSITKP
jgi:hypothetical protein